jgi:glycosyltransferase involved in cell wall biosynthesis
MIAMDVSGLGRLRVRLAALGWKFLGFRSRRKIYTSLIRKIPPNLTEPVREIVPAHQRLVVIFWPDYSQDNPYQTLLNGDSSSEYEFLPGDINKAIRRVQTATRGQKIVFHLHWLNAIIKARDTSARAERAAQDFLNQVRDFVRLGGHLVWTIHNVAIHDGPHFDLEMRTRRVLSELASVIHVHGEATLNAAAAMFPIEASKTVVAEHGSFIGVYADQIGRADARARLGINEKALVFTHFGLLRPYKGVDLLLQNLSSIGPPQDVEPVALIAGKPNGIAIDTIRRCARDNLKTICHLDHVEDQHIQLYMNASDFLVLPYRKVLTSGTAILGLSFGVPIIAPRTGLLPELLQHGRQGILYEPEDNDGLADALKIAMAMSPQDRAAMAARARLKAEQLQWKRTRKKLLTAIVRVI